MTPERVPSEMIQRGLKSRHAHMIAFGGAIRLPKSRLRSQIDVLVRLCCYSTKLYHRCNPGN